MARQDVNRAYYLRKKLQGLDKSQKCAIISQMNEKDKLAYWRAEILKKYREWGTFKTEALSILGTAKEICE